MKYLIIILFLASCNSLEKTELKEQILNNDSKMELCKKKCYPYNSLGFLTIGKTSCLCGEK
jgi:hypothetical protein